MSTTAVAPPPAGVTTPPPAAPFTPPITVADIYRLTVEQYQRMVDTGILMDGDPVELLDGYLVAKMGKNRPHVIATQHVRTLLERLLPAGWSVGVQDPITLDSGEPEPDVTVFRGTADDYPTTHPTPADVPLVVEVSHASLPRDREWKRRMYARNGIPVYWIVNVEAGVLEVYTDPAGGDYATARTLTRADRADVVIAGATVGTAAAADILP